MRIGSALLLLLLLAAGASGDDKPGARTHVQVRGIYGGMPQALMEEGRTLADAGVNAVWIGERSVSKKRVAALKAQGARIFVEFNTLHRADYLKKHPDAAPVERSGKRAPAPHGWQGICPTHPSYRNWRMAAFRALLKDLEIDGVWLDYHHAHASWERAEPDLPDTCFCPRCIRQFLRDASPAGVTESKVRTQLDPKNLTIWSGWIDWRCSVFTDWVREFREILDETRPKALLGTFHCPWTDTERGGALGKKLAIDLRGQKPYLDVFSPMPYHARFGHAKTPSWIGRQTAWLGEHLGLKGEAQERVKIWPIVQLADWGEAVPVQQVAQVLDYGTRRPATGVLVFRWNALKEQPEKVDAMVDFYRAIGRD